MFYFCGYFYVILAFILLLFADLNSDFLKITVALILLIDNICQLTFRILPIVWIGFKSLVCFWKKFLQICVKLTSVYVWLTRYAR